MKTRREKVLLTGASGAMGFEAFKELWRRRRRYDIVLILRPSRVNKKMFATYERRAGATSIEGRGIVESKSGDFKIVWGDATRYEDVLTAVRSVDWILSPMAVIPPEADHNPALAEAVNVTAVEHLLNAIKAQPNGADHIKFVYIGSVAQYGDRLPPAHMIRAGDPLLASVFDFYATTKVAGERRVIDSGLKHWVSLRQTYIAIPESATKLDPIMFHQPLQTHIEMNTARDAGYGLVQCLDVPENSDFWRRIYNFAGGPACRLVFLPYMQKMMRLLGFGEVTEIMDRRWFALRNFHCGWFLDSADLNGHLHHWRDSLDDHYRQVQDAAPLYLRLAGLKPIANLIPSALMRTVMYGLALRKYGTAFWIRNGLDQRIKAFYGSLEAYYDIPNWHAPLWDESLKPIAIDHGYDESKLELELSDLQAAAKFRGGRLVSTSWTRDLHAQVTWESAGGERFSASPTAVLKGGHWAPAEQAPPWRYDAIAKSNPFVAQIWHANHDAHENNYYAADCYKDIL